MKKPRCPDHDVEFGLVYRCVQCDHMWVVRPADGTYQRVRNQMAEALDRITALETANEAHKRCVADLEKQIDAILDAQLGELAAEGKRLSGESEKLRDLLRQVEEMRKS